MPCLNIYLVEGFTPRVYGFRALANGVLILSKDPVNAKVTNLHEYDEVSQEESKVIESALIKDVLWVYNKGLWVQGTRRHGAYAC